jgi:hypothetical protein
MVGEGDAGLIASLEGLLQCVGGFLASRGHWGVCAGVHSRVVVNLSAIHSCGIREPINFSFEAETVHAKQGGVGHSQGLEEVHESDGTLARRWWVHRVTSEVQQ